MKILIKTYGHESGLLYLGLSLRKHLESLGHQVKFIPKSKYVSRGGRFVSSYLPIRADLRESFYSFNDGINGDGQIISAVLDFKADKIISLETLMQNSSWILKAKKLGVKVIDVPMLEWVSPAYFNRMSYNVFDKVWAVTDYTMETFLASSYANVNRVTWDFVDRDLFFKNKDMLSNEVYRFYHQASLNPGYTSKNTNLVIKAFDKLSNKFGDTIRLDLTGNIQDKNVLEIIEKHTNIYKYNEVLDRIDIANLYKNIDCVVAPSSREGLGLSLFEAKACGCDLITTNASPMNSLDTKYLCEVSGFTKDKSLVPIAKLTEDSVYRQMEKAYEEKYIERKA